MAPCDQVRVERSRVASIASNSLTQEEKPSKPSLSAAGIATSQFEDPHRFRVGIVTSAFSPLRWGPLVPTGSSTPDADPKRHQKGPCKRPVTVGDRTRPRVPVYIRERQAWMGPDFL